MLALAAIKGAGWLVCSRFFGRSIDFLNLLILARFLSPADFGITALAATLILVVDVVFEIPVSQVLVRLKEVDKPHLDTGFTLSLLRSLALAVVLLVAMWPYAMIRHDPLLIPVIAVMALAPVIKGFMSPAMVRYNRDLDFSAVFMLEAGSKLSGLVCAVVAVVLDAGFWAVVTNFVVTAVVTTAGSYLMAPYRPKLSLAHFSDFAGFIGWFSSAQLVSAVNWQFDRLLVGAAGTPTMLGQYAVASDMAVLPTQSLVGPALQPVMAAFAKINSDTDRMRAAVLKSARFAMLASIPICLGISLTADLLTDILLGPQWKNAAPYLSLLAISVLPVPYFQILYAASLSLNKAKTIFRLNLLDLCLRVTLVCFGFYMLEATGAAAARIVLSFIMLLFYMDEMKRLLSLSIHEQLKNVWKIVFAATMMLVLVPWVRTSMTDLGVNSVLQLLMAAAAGSAIYIATLWLLGMRLRFGMTRLELTG